MIKKQTDYEIHLIKLNLRNCFNKQILNIFFLENLIKIKKNNTFET